TRGGAGVDQEKNARGVDDLQEAEAVVVDRMGPNLHDDSFASNEKALGLASAQVGLGLIRIAHPQPDRPSGISRRRTSVRSRPSTGSPWCCHRGWSARRTSRTTWSC